MKKDILLFDLGGVIVPWVGLDALAEKNNLSRDAVIDRFARSDIAHAYETGQCDDDTFLREMLSLFEMSLEPHEFAQLWNSWVHPPYPGILAALQVLKGSYTIACLSNTNALHWAHLNQMFRTEELFDFDFASHLIHAAKPDPQSYLIPLEQMQAEASEVTFFDDTLDNVEAARALGISSHLVDRSQGVLPLLKHLNYIA